MIFLTRGQPCRIAMMPGGSKAVASPRRRPGEEQDECGDNRAGECWVRGVQFPSHNFWLDIGFLELVEKTLLRQ